MGGLIHQFEYLSAMTYDNVHQQLYFCDNEHKNTTIFSLKMMGNTFDVQPLVMRNFTDNVLGIAFDPIAEILYWTDGNTKSIYWLSLVPGSEIIDNGKVLLNMTQEEQPQAIVVDSCRRMIYWTNVGSKPTIESMSVDGRDRKIIVQDDLHSPFGITIDHASKKIFWTNDLENNYFKIESANLDGTNRTLVYYGRNHQPASIAVNKGTIYWTDWIHKSIWKLNPNSANETQPVTFKAFSIENPNAIVSRVNFLEDTKDFPECQAVHDLISNVTHKQLQNWEEQDKGIIANIPRPINIVSFCLNGGSLGEKTQLLTGNKVCNCPRGYIGDRCEISLCHNFCLNGTCVLDNRGYPKCRCLIGFFGIRCSKSVCQGYCLNNGTCEVNNSARATCNCLQNWGGNRCHIQNVTISPMNLGCQSNNNTVVNVNDTNNVTKVKLVNDKTNETQTLSSDDRRENNSDSSLLFKSSDSLEINSLEDMKDSPMFDVQYPALIVLSVICAVLSMLTVVLTRKIVILRRRPRIKKRIIVNKNVTPLTYRPGPPQCEITIENCCNMNICETPCFEASNIQAQIADMNRKDEKKHLLLNPELQDSNY